MLWAAVFNAEYGLLNFILDKEFLLNEISLLKERSVDENYINYTIIKNDNEINIFFDKRNFFLI